MTDTKRILVLLLTCSLLAGVLGGCSLQKRDSNVPGLLEPASQEAGTILVEKKELLSAEYLDVTAVPVSEKLHLTIGGLIDQTCVGVGDLVEEGQVLLTLDDTQLEKQIESLENRISALQTQYSYGESAASYAISAASLSQAKAEEDAEAAAKQKEEAEKEKEEAKKRLEEAKKAESERLAKAAQTAQEAAKAAQDIQAKEDELDGAVTLAEANLEACESRVESWTKELENAKKELEAAQKELEKLLSGAAGADDQQADPESASRTEEDDTAGAAGDTPSSDTAKADENASSDTAGADADENPSPDTAGAETEDDAGKSETPAEDPVLKAREKKAAAEKAVADAESALEEAKKAVPEAAQNVKIAKAEAESGKKLLGAQKELAAKEKEAREKADAAEKEAADEQIKELENAVSSAEKLIEQLDRTISGHQYMIQMASVQTRKAQLNLSQLQQDHSQQLSQMNQQLELLKGKRGLNVLTAPYAGRIIKVNFYEGQYLNAYETAVMIADESQLVFEGPAFNNTALASFTKLDIEINGNILPVRYLAYDPDEYLKKTMNGENLPSRFELKDDPSGEKNQVGYGENGTVRLYYGYRQETLVIPRSCVLADDYGSYVYADEDGQRTKTYITLGLGTTAYVEVLGGLEEGDVLYDGE